VIVMRIVRVLVIIVVGMVMVPGMIHAASL